MPRLTPLRILLCIPLLWSTPFLLYVFLPFPQVSQSHRADHIQHQLTHGHTLTTVVKLEGLYEKASQYGNPGALAIEWRFSLADTGTNDPRRNDNEQSILLHIGKSSTINITSALLNSTSSPTGNYSTAPFKTRVISGDDPESKVIVPPWFPWAEGTLFDSADHYAEVDLGLKVKLVGRNVIEVWSDPWFINKERLDRGAAPIYEGAPRETGLLAAFTVGENGEKEQSTSVEARTVEKRIPVQPVTSLPELIRVQHVRGGLLSSTFGIRQWLLRAFESPIFINFYICALVIMPREALEISTFLIIPLVICYTVIGYVTFVVLRKVTNGVRRLYRIVKRDNGEESRGSRVKLPAWMRDDGGVEGIVVGERNRLLQRELSEEG